MIANKIKDINYDIIKCDYEDGHVDYMIKVTFKSKGLLFGWNKRSFILERYGSDESILSDQTYTHSFKFEWAFVDDYESFERAWDRQASTNAFNCRFIKTETVQMAQYVIEHFKLHCEFNEQTRKSKTIFKKTKI